MNQIEAVDDDDDDEDEVEGKMKRQTETFSLDKLPEERRKGILMSWDQSQPLLTDWAYLSVRDALWLPL